MGKWLVENQRLQIDEEGLYQIQICVKIKNIYEKTAGGSYFWYFTDIILNLYWPENDNYQNIITVHKNISLKVVGIIGKKNLSHSIH